MDISSTITIYLDKQEEKNNMLYYKDLNQHQLISSSFMIALANNISNNNMNVTTNLPLSMQSIITTSPLSSLSVLPTENNSPQMKMKVLL